MLSPINVYNFLTSPETYLYELQKKYGDPFPLTFSGAPTVWLTGEPHLAQSIFTAPPDSFKASEKNPVGPLLGNGGLIMQSGPAHLHCRKELGPFFSKKNLAPFSHEIVDLFLKLDESKKKSGTLVIQEFALQSTLKIILRFLFPHLSIEEMNEAHKLTQDFLKSYSASFLFLPHWVPGTWSRFEQKKIDVDQRFYDFFLQGHQSDVLGPLSALINLKKEDVLDHIRTFIVAGHETSATSLSWALYYIHSDPYIKNRLLEELNVFFESSKEDFLETVMKNQFLDLIISESLRIKPPVPFVTRKIINREFQLGSKTLAIGEELGVCISLLHRSEKVWSDPSSFLPDRFFNRKYSPYEYAPFGGGIRKCIGAELALLELKIIVGFFMKYYQADLLESAPIESEVMQITIGPKKGMSLQYQKRKFF